jgi:hypothetical protein
MYRFDKFVCEYFWKIEENIYNKNLIIPISILNVAGPERLINGMGILISTL